MTPQETNNTQRSLVKENNHRWGRGREMRWKSEFLYRCKRDREQQKVRITFTSKRRNDWAIQRMYFRIIFHRDVAAVVTSVFPRGRGVVSAVSWHWWWQTTSHRRVYSARWCDSSRWTSLSGAVGTGAGCCRKIGFFLKMPEFHPVSDSSLHLRPLQSHPVEIKTKRRIRFHKRQS